MSSVKLFRSLLCTMLAWAAANNNGSAFQEWVSNFDVDPPVNSGIVPMALNAQASYTVYGSTSDEGETPILWVHGLPVNSTSWYPQLEYFQHKTQNIVVDLAGCGSTSQVPAGVNITDFDIDVCLAVLDHLNVSQAIVVGFASGGHPVLRLAARHPDRVLKFVVINSSPRFRTTGDPDWPWGFNDTVIAKFQHLIDTEDVASVVRTLLIPALKDPCPDETTFLQQVIVDMAENSGIYPVREFWHDMCFDDDVALMSNITSPALFITSSQSTVVPFDVAYKLRTLVNGTSAVVEVSAADHFVFMTQAPIVNHILDQFMAPQCHLYNHP
mmetsp:Transcript_1496/g.2236  ORF Transcript_1496/g.2236 Transcript_1496/m.2236 type:complete len:327 (+) Transcript_1496:203-1183(+)